MQDDVVAPAEPPNGRFGSLAACVMDPSCCEAALQMDHLQTGQLDMAACAKSSLSKLENSLIDMSVRLQCSVRWLISPSQLH